MGIPRRYSPHGMRTEARVLAPAKVNLHLEVCARREDGFHDIVSLFQAVSLYDELHLTVTEAELGIRVTGDFGLPMAQNIITRAARVFLEETGIDAGIDVEVVKRIPMGAGLGGGSSDAAATLRCLAELLAPSMSLERLHAMAVGLGSDVPFFLNSVAALVTGRGDLVTSLQPRTDFTLAAVFPGICVGTAEAYISLDSAGRTTTAPRSPREVMECYAAMPMPSWGFMNSFDEVVFALHPALAGLRDALLSEGAARAGLTGSGSTVVGLFEQEQAALRCVSALGAAGHSAVFLRPLATIPRVC
jgi:4-diphosphocytidyl-2-C-methyl-D-erythritol kinase